MSESVPDNAARREHRVGSRSGEGRSGGRRFSPLRALLIVLGSVLILVLVILTALSAVLSTHSGSRWLLGTVTDMVSSEDLQIHYEQMEGTFLWGMDLHQFQVQMGDNSIRAARLHSRWNPFTLLNAEFNLDALTISDLQVQWRSEPGSEQPDTGDGGSLEDTIEGILPLPITIRLSRAHLDGALIQYDETVYELTSLRFNASLQDYHLQVEQLVYDADPILLSGNLDLLFNAPYAVDARLEWQLAQELPGGSEQIIGDLVVRGDLNRLALTHALSHPLQLHTEGSLTLGLADLFTGMADEMQLAVDLNHTLPAQILPFPGLEDYLLEHALLRTQGTLEQLQIAGTVELLASLLPGDALPVSIDLTAQLQGQELVLEDLRLNTPTGRVSSDGLLSWGDVLGMELAIDAQENDPAAYVSALPEDIQLEQLSASGRLQLRITEEGPQGSFQLDSLQGQLNEFPLNGHASVQFAGSAVEVHELHLHTGENTVDLSGRYDETIDAHLRVAAPQLSAFHPDLGGSLELRATLNGSLEDLLIDIDADASALSFGDITVQQVHMLGVNRGNTNEITLSIGGIRLPAEDPDEAMEISGISLQLMGQPESHQFELSVDSEYAQLALAAEGQFSEGQWRGTLQRSDIDSLVGRWQQVQASSLLVSAAAVEVESTCWQQGPGSFCVSASLDEEQRVNALVSLNDYSLATLNQQEALAIINSFPGNEDLLLELSPAAALPFNLPPNVALRGVVSAQLAVNGVLSDDPADLNIELRADTRDGELYVSSDTAEPGEDNGEPEVQQFLWDDAMLTGERVDNVWHLRSAMSFYQLSVVDTGIAMRGSVDAELNMDAGQALDGELRLSFDDIGWLEAFAPQITNVQGELNGRVGVAGTLDEPAIGGEIRLLEAALDVPALNLNITGLTFNVLSEDVAHVRISGSAESGQGTLIIGGEIFRPLEESRELNLSLTGSQFMVADLPELRLAISPDLQATASTEGIHTAGTLRIPTLNAEITALPETAVDVSTDAVLYTQREDVAVRNAAQVDRGILGDIPISAEVRIILGEDVNFSAFGLTAKLQGLLDINQQPGRAPLTYGELEVAEGSFEIYGRVLNIEQGKLLFFGSYDNPAIDIRAARDVEHMKVGVQMSGTIRNIRSQLFSTPSLPDGDILAVMITGRPLSEIGTQQDGNALVGAITTLGISQGEPLTDRIRGQLGLDTLELSSTGEMDDSAVTLGKYITPRIFVRYAVGLFETESRLAIDYTITDNIKLEAVSGQNQSIDLTYTLER